MRLRSSCLVAAILFAGCHNNNPPLVSAPPVNDAGPQDAVAMVDGQPPDIALLPVDAAPPVDARPDSRVAGRLDPAQLNKFVDPVARPRRLAGFNRDGTGRRLVIGMFEIHQKLHKQLPPTRVWGYGVSAAQASYPGPTIDARPGIQTEVLWQNRLPNNHFLPVDTTIPWAKPATWPGAGVPTVVHVHGGLQEAASDGHPGAWFTPGFKQTGPAFVKQLYRYTNQNAPETLWYHDHALGLTRLNVYAGLAGFYLLRDPARDLRLGLPSGSQELEMVLQDRSFNSDGSLFYPKRGDNPSVHPSWVPEFFGDVNLVNGVIWPYQEVEPKRYRFRILNGANARFYNLRLSNGGTFIKIGTSGGFLGKPVRLKQILLGPGERADVIVDFTGLQRGTRIELRNDARAPYPSGDPVNEHTSRLMQFRVVASTGPDKSVVPTNIDRIPALGTPVATRTMTLAEVLDAKSGMPTALLLNGKRWSSAGDVTELPRVGTTEVWELVNLTKEAHPIHLHLVDFQLLNRQSFDATGYRRRYEQLNPELPAQTIKRIDVRPFLQGNPQRPVANEQGWKDTVIALPGQVTRFTVRWRPERGGSFPFDATAAPGYVWHCHILEHEDNEMMRPFKLIAPEQK